MNVKRNKNSQIFLGKKKHNKTPGAIWSLEPLFPVSAEVVQSPQELTPLALALHCFNRRELGL